LVGHANDLLSQCCLEGGGYVSFFCCLNEYAAAAEGSQETRVKKGFGRVVFFITVKTVIL
jgi:hypothetical protein